MRTLCVSKVFKNKNYSPDTRLQSHVSKNWLGRHSRVATSASSCTSVASFGGDDASSGSSRISSFASHFSVSSCMIVTAIACRGAESCVCVCVRAQPASQVPQEAL